jgi:superfamily II DNA/RNA helicase
LDRVRPDRQTLLFSATLDGDVDVLVKRYQRRPARHELAVDEDVPTNEHVFWRASRDQRIDLTARVVQRNWPAVVFCRTKRGADRVARRLSTLGVPSAAIHGDRSQNQREAALAAFGAGKVMALVATDVAARGIHVDGVACVVHADPPADEKDFVHRSGRTGRAGATGLVVCLVDGDQVADVRRIQRKLDLPQGVTAPDEAKLAEPGSRPVVPARSASRPEPAATVADLAPAGARRRRRPASPAAPSAGGHRSPAERGRGERSGGERPARAGAPAGGGARRSSGGEQRAGASRGDRRVATANGGGRPAAKSRRAPEGAGRSRRSR